MALRKPKSHLSVDEYLAAERDNPVRHEYVHGQAYAMAGASDRHNRIAGNIFARLSDHLTEGPCEPFISDMKVEVSEDLYYYPDVMVACDPPGEDRYTKRQPVLIVEVLSPATERIDRYEKLMSYRSVTTLREYVLIAQDEMRVEIYRRQEDSTWQHVILTQPHESLEFSSAALSLTLAQVYRRVQLDEE